MIQIFQSCAPYKNKKESRCKENNISGFTSAEKRFFLQPREQVCNNITPPNGSKSTKQSTFAEKQKCSVSDRDLMNRNWIGN